MMPLRPMMVLRPMMMLRPIAPGEGHFAFPKAAAAPSTAEAEPDSRAGAGPRVAHGQNAG